MKRIKLENSDLASASTIVNKYREAEVELLEIQKKLEDLDVQKTELLTRLEAVNEEEITFFNSLEKRYGKGHLDLLTFEYLTKK
jgi:hypothetical protein